MKCASCQRESPADASFCSGCGSKLGIVCADCGRASVIDAAFCGGCGRNLSEASPTADAAHQHEARDVTPPHLAAKILRDRATLEGERRTVTVLFIDAVGSVSIGERIDQEQLHRITHEATERMTSAVHRFEGTVAQFRGDGIMALFGAPIAHEDTARRAIAAAIAMRDSLAAYDRELRGAGSAGFTYRIGLHTGPVIVGRIGDDLSMDYTAIGDTVNLAARMEQSAAPGKIFVTDQTRRLASGYFEFADLGALEVKGKREAVRAFEVGRELASRTRLDVAVASGLSAYVGREHELSVLRSHFDQAAGGRGQIVFISGEAGMGKSRLMLEFRRSLGDVDYTWLTGQCISYGRGIPYLPIIDVLKRSFGIDENDDDTAIIERIDERASSWDETTRQSVPYVKFLLNVDPGDARVASMEPAERRAGILDALRAMLVRGSSERPVVLLIEDLHWIDEKSEEAIAALVDMTASARVLMILTYRPGYTDSLGDRSYYNRVSLHHLPLGDCDALVGGILPDGACPEAIRRLITARADGNPFYLEEVTKSLVESGTLRVTDGTYALSRSMEDVRIPETIQEVILTRIDRLEVESREAIQLASVIGREFTARLLERMSDTRDRVGAQLDELKKLELIYEKAFFPELSYMFKHALTHDVAYSTLLTERRKVLHRIVGAAVEELYADRLHEQYETLAHHYELAEDWSKAFDYLVKAGRKAHAAYANADASSYYARAMDVAERPDVPVTAAQFTAVAQAHADIAITTGDMKGGIADTERAIRIAVEQGDITSEARGLSFVGVAQYWLHDFDAAEATLNRAIALSEQDSNDDARFSAYVFSMELGGILYGPRVAARYRELADRTRHAATDPYAIAGYVANAVFLAEYWTSYYGDAIAKYEALHAEKDALPLSAWMIAFDWSEGLALAHAGQYSKALARFNAVLELTARVGEVLFAPRTYNSIGWIHGELQDHLRAIEWDQRSFDAAQVLGLPDPEIECNAFLNAADSLLVLGRLDEAEERLAFVGRVVADPAPAERFALWRYSQHYLHTYGELQLLRGDAETAVMFAEKCLRQAEDTDVRKNIVKGLRLRGQARAALGDLSAADADIVTALTLSLDVGNPGQIWKTYEALGDLCRAQQRDADAGTAYAEALAVLESMAAGLDDDDLRTTLLASAAVQRMRAASALIAGRG